MKIQVVRLKLNYETGTAIPEGGIIFNLENEQQKKSYLDYVLKIEDGYAYNFSVEKDGE